MTGARRNSQATFWVTRTRPDNAGTVDRLRPYAQRVLAVPVLASHAIPSRWPAEPPDALVFTSINGVRYHQAQPEFSSCPVLAVGDRTAQAASSAGYSDVRSAGGDVRDLERLVCDTIPRGRRILHLSARRPAGDLVGRLASAGYDAKRLPVYATQPVSSATLAQTLPSMTTIDGILIHSPRAGRLVRSFLATTRSKFHGSIYCISHAAAAPFDGLLGVRVIAAAQPTEDALLHLVAAASQE